MLYFYWTELAKAALDFHSSVTPHSLYFLLFSFRAVSTKPGPVLNQHCKEVNKAHRLPSVFPTLYHTHTHAYYLLFFNYLFIYFWLHWVFVAARGLSLVAASGGYSSLRCTGFSLQWLLLFQSTGSRCTGFSSCGTWAQ